MIQQILLITQMIWMISIKLLKNTIQIRKVMIVFDDMIADMLSNKKFNLIVLEKFKRNITEHFSCFYDTILFRCSKKLSD